MYGKNHGLRAHLLSWVGIVFVCFGLVLAAACNPPLKGKFGEKCLFSADCDEGLKCIQSICSTSKGLGDTCLNTSECGGNLKCHDAQCAFGKIQTCTKDSQCGTGNQCFKSPSEDKQYCAAKSGEGFPCTNDEDCKVASTTSALQCSGRFCLKASGANSPCPDTKSCLSPLVCGATGLCIQPGQPGTGGSGDKCSSQDDCQKGLLCDTKAGTCAEGGAEGQPCKDTFECKGGLVCSNDAKCTKKGEPGTAGSGDGCAKQTDCQATLVCGSSGTCTPRGAIAEGQPCAGSEQCLEGLVCAAKAGETTGTCAKPGGEGTTVAGGKCEKQEDCAFGLVCGFSATCTPFRPYTGTECEASDKITGPFRVFFEVPRDGKDVKEFYRLPFPNDGRLTSSGKINLKGHANPGPLLGEDLVGRYIKAIESELKGFSTSPTTFFRFSQGIKFSSIDLNGEKPGVVYVNLTRNRYLGSNIRYSPSKGKYICQNYMTVRPARSTPLEHGETFAVIITKVIKNNDGEAIQADEDFKKLLGDSAPSDAAMKRAYDAYAPLRDFLKKNGETGKWPGPSDVVSAAVFTTQKPTDYFSKFQQVVKDRPDPKLLQLTLCDGKNTSPCAEKDSTQRKCGPTNDDFYEFHAKVEVPIFMTGKAPYKEDGGSIEFDGSGLPKVARVEEVCLALTVPKKGTMPADGWPVAIYAHGTGGSFRSHVVDGTAKRLSSITSKDKDGKDVTVGYITIGIDQHLHGPRRNGDTTHPNFLFFNFRNPHAALNNYIQNAADQYTITKLAQVASIAKDKSPTGADVTFDAKKIVYVGHSQGGVAGPMFLAFATDVKAAVLSGAGGSIVQSLLNKTQPINIAKGIQGMFGELQPVSVDHPMMHLIQTYFDRNDPANYGQMIAKEPPKDVPPKHILQTYGLDDAFTPPVTMEILARVMGVQQVGPSETSISGISNNKIDPPARGNLQTQGKSITATFGQYRPKGYDGHFVLFQHEDTIRHFTQFLGTFLTDEENIPTHVK